MHVYVNMRVCEYACMRVYMCINVSNATEREVESARRKGRKMESGRCTRDMYASKERNERERKRQVREKGANKKRERGGRLRRGPLVHERRTLITSLSD